MSEDKMAWLVFWIGLVVLVGVAVYVLLTIDTSITHSLEEFI